MPGQWHPPRRAGLTVLALFLEKFPIFKAISIPGHVPGVTTVFPAGSGHTIKSVYVCHKNTIASHIQAFDDLIMRGAG
ncbi:MAG: hypothetical protein ABF791_05480 [Acetobacter sp.]